MKRLSKVESDIYRKRKCCKKWCENKEHCKNCIFVFWDASGQDMFGYECYYKVSVEESK